MTGALKIDGIAQQNQGNKTNLQNFVGDDCWKPVTCKTKNDTGEQYK
jgi:hypothetical protein